MGDVPAALHGEEEVVRHAGGPALVGGGPLQRVERAVELHAVHQAGDVLQLPALRQPARVEPAAPLPVAPAGHAHSHVGRHVGPHLSHPVTVRAGGCVLTCRGPIPARPGHDPSIRRVGRRRERRFRQRYRAASGRRLARERRQSRGGRPADGRQRGCGRRSAHRPGGPAGRAGGPVAHPARAERGQRDPRRGGAAPGPGVRARHPRRGCAPERSRASAGGGVRALARRAAAGPAPGRRPGVAVPAHRPDRRHRARRPRGSSTLPAASTSGCATARWASGTA